MKKAFLALCFIALAVTLVACNKLLPPSQQQPQTLNSVESEKSTRMQPSLKV